MKKHQRKAPEVRPKDVRPKEVRPKEVQPKKDRKDLVVCAALVVLTLAVYSQVAHFQFVNFDDREVILGNTHVRDGITAGGIAWAFTSPYAANWFPVTWISHMLDCQLFGLDAGWHHLVNLAIHTLSMLLLFGLMKRMTGSYWPSAFVAFAFALHPLHVESVAWVSERKDVLSALFAFLTIWAYLFYVRQPGIGRYLWMILAFGLGLMSKQMLVTLPFALLLLDIWPLRRSKFGSLLLEKTPLFVMSIAASIVTFIVQRHGGALQTTGAISLLPRIENALVSYAAYVIEFVWPAGLAVFYPHPLSWPIWEVVASGLALTVITILVLRAFRRMPYLSVGWLWYLGILVPVIGIVQVGEQSRADRYTYLPMIGISIMVAWGLADALERWPRAKTSMVAAAITICCVWVAVTWVQIQYWSDSVALFGRAIAVTSDNYVAHVNLGIVLAENGRTGEALEHLDRAVRARPDYADAHSNLGAVLGTLGRNAEAAEQFSETIRLRPNDPEAHYNLGNTLIVQGRMNEAAKEFAIAVQISPGFANAQSSLGGVLASLGRLDEAIEHLTEAVRLNPDLQYARQALERAQSERRMKQAR